MYIYTNSFVQTKGGLDINRPFPANHATELSCIDMSNSGNNLLLQLFFFYFFKN